MAYLTDRKRATGLGSAKSGTEHFWAMKVSSVALLILIPLFVFTFGAALGGTYEEVVAYYSRPGPAIIAALTIPLSSYYVFPEAIIPLSLIALVVLFRHYDNIHRLLSGNEDSFRK